MFSRSVERPNLRRAFYSCTLPADLRQVFVANPKKPPPIENILRRNKDKLLIFLRNFHNDKEGASLALEVVLRLTDVHVARRAIHGTCLPVGRTS